MLPLVVSLLSLILGKKLAHKTGWLVCFTFLYTTALSLFATTQVMNGDVLLEVYNWAPQIGVVVGFKADGLSAPFMTIISVLACALSLYSIPYMKHKIGDKESEYGLYYALFLLFVSSMQGTILSTNLIEFFVFFEFMLIPSYLLIAKWGYGERIKISLMYFLWTHVGALLLLIGILLVYTMVGSFDIYEIPQLIQQFRPSLEMTFLASSLMLLGFFVKMALFGLHVWLPYVHAEAPTPISSLLSPAMIGIGGYATVRTTMAFFPNTFQLTRDILSIWALLTMLYGGILALTEDDLKRRLAYSSISQMGYILLGISSYEVLGVSGSMLHYISHCTCKALLFMVAGSIVLQADGLRNIKKLGGLASNMPITAAAAIVGFLGLMGIPPLNGFNSEWMIFTGIFSAAVKSGSVWQLLLASVSVISTILTAGYGLWTIHKIFFGARPEYLEDVREAPWTVTLPLVVLIFATVLLGLLPSALINSISQIITAIFT